MTNLLKLSTPTEHAEPVQNIQLIPINISKKSPRTGGRGVITSFSVPGISNIGFQFLSYANNAI